MAGMSQKMVIKVAMKHLSCVLLALLISGCSFITTTPSPLFVEDDFVVPITDGSFSTREGQRVEVKFQGRSFAAQFVDGNKTINVVGGVVPTKFQDYFLLQVSRTGKAVNTDVYYIPMRISDDALLLLFKRVEDTAEYDAVFVRHGFTKDNGVWSHPLTFDRPELLSFYAELIDVIASDPLWSDAQSKPQFDGMIFLREKSP